MTSLRRALLDAEAAMMDDAAVARARRRVAARLEAQEPERRWPSWLVPALAGVGVGVVAMVGLMRMQDAEPVILAEPVPLPTVEAVPAPTNRPPSTRPGGMVPSPAITTSKADGDEGKLVAIAIGGTCEFWVDGEKIKRASSIRITVPVGHHTVTCRRPNGKERRQTIRVKSSKPGIASFRIDDSDAWPDATVIDLEEIDPPPSPPPAPPVPPPRRDFGF